MTKERQAESKMVLLTEEEHAFLFELVLDYGTYAGEREVRNGVARKLGAPHRIRDLVARRSPRRRRSVPVMAPESA